MTTATATLADFLLARIAEDEAVAREARDAPESEWWVNPRQQTQVRGAPSTRGPVAEAIGWRTARHIARHDPARVLAECEAKRRIVALHGMNEPFHVDPCDAHDASGHTVPCDTLRTLALPYADAPGFQEEWR